jgi:hypothetical protein
MIETYSKRDFVKPGAIPWLLPRWWDRPEPDEGGWLTETKYIQRVYTAGGLAPTAAVTGGRANGCLNHTQLTTSSTKSPRLE